MNTKGFTLIELVTIILILAAIFLVSFPNFLNTAKMDEEKKYEEMEESLCLAGESYIYSNIDSFSEALTTGGRIEVSIKELIIYGNVKSDLINPKTNKKVENDNLIFTVLNNGALKCVYKDV